MAADGEDRRFVYPLSDQDDDDNDSGGEGEDKARMGMVGADHGGGAVWTGAEYVARLGHRAGPDGEFLCDECQEHTVHGQCTTCKMMLYCSSECQLNDWHNGHSAHCIAQIGASSETKRPSESDQTTTKSSKSPERIIDTVAVTGASDGEMLCSISESEDDWVLGRGARLRIVAGRVEAAQIVRGMRLRSPGGLVAEATAHGSDWQPLGAVCGHAKPSGKLHECRGAACTPTCKIVLVSLSTARPGRQYYQQARLETLIAEQTPVTWQELAKLMPGAWQALARNRWGSPLRAGPPPAPATPVTLGSGSQDAAARIFAGRVEIRGASSGRAEPGAGIVMAFSPKEIAKACNSGAVTADGLRTAHEMLARHSAGARLMAPGALGSALRHTIRFAPRFVVSDASGDTLQTRCTGEEFACAAFALLYDSCGGYNAEARAYLDGPVMALKQLAMSLYEDAWPFTKGDEDANEKLEMPNVLLAAACAAHTAPVLLAGAHDVLERAFRTCVAAVGASAVFRHANNKVGSAAPYPGHDPLASPRELVASATTSLRVSESTLADVKTGEQLVEALGRFDKDVALIRSVYGTLSGASPFYERPERMERPSEMPLCHVIDEATFPVLGYLVDSSPLAVRQLVTAVNSRRTVGTEPESDGKNFEKGIERERAAQRLVLQLLHSWHKVASSLTMSSGDISERPDTVSFATIIGKLAPSALAHAVGPIEVEGAAVFRDAQMRRVTACVCLGLTNPHDERVLLKVDGQNADAVKRYRTLVSDKTRRIRGSMMGARESTSGLDAQLDDEAWCEKNIVYSYFEPSERVAIVEHVRGRHGASNPIPVPGLPVLGRLGAETWYEPAAGEWVVAIKPDAGGRPVAVPWSHYVGAPRGCVARSILTKILSCAPAILVDGVCPFAAATATSMTMTEPCGRVMTVGDMLELAVAVRRLSIPTAGGRDCYPILLAFPREARDAAASRGWSVAPTDDVSVAPAAAVGHACAIAGPLATRELLSAMRATGRRGIVADTGRAYALLALLAAVFPRALALRDVVADIMDETVFGWLVDAVARVLYELPKAPRSVGIREFGMPKLSASQVEMITEMHSRDETEPLVSYRHLLFSLNVGVVMAYLAQLARRKERGPNFAQVLWITADQNAEQSIRQTAAEMAGIEVRRPGQEQRSDSGAGVGMHLWIVRPDELATGTMYYEMYGTAAVVIDQIEQHYDSSWERDASGSLADRALSLARAAPVLICRSDAPVAGITYGGKGGIAQKWVAHTSVSEVSERNWLVPASALIGDPTQIPLVTSDVLVSIDAPFDEMLARTAANETQRCPKDVLVVARDAAHATALCEIINRLDVPAVRAVGSGPPDPGCRIVVVAQAEWSLDSPIPAALWARIGCAMRFGCAVRGEYLGSATEHARLVASLRGIGQLLSPIRIVTVVPVDPKLLYEDKRSWILGSPVESAVSFGQTASLTQSQQVAVAHALRSTCGDYSLPSSSSSSSSLTPPVGNVLSAHTSTPAPGPLGSKAQYADLPKPIREMLEPDAM